MSLNSRRRFLKQSGLAVTGLTLGAPEALASALIKNLFSSSRAEAADLVSPRYYLNIYAEGGPPRHVFDHWLRTNTEDPNLVFNPSTGTAFTYDNNRLVTGTEYRTINYNGVLVPQMYAYLSPADRAAFLDSFLVIRGYGSGIDGHGFNAALQMHPLAAAPSLSGHVADHTARYFEALQYRSRFSASRFVSSKNVSLNFLTGEDPLSDLLKPLLASTDKARALRSGYQDVFTNVRGYLNSLNSDRKSVSIARKSLSNAYDLFKSNIADFSTIWPALLSEYQTVVETAIRASGLPGFNATLDGTQSIAAVSNGEISKYKLNGTSSFVLGTGKNLLDTGSSMTMSRLISGLALADYCISNDLTGALEIVSGNSSEDLLIDPTAGAVSTNMYSMPNDMHNTTQYGTVFVTTLYFRGLLAGLLHLRSKLISAGKWNQTVVQLVSDFGRPYTNNGSGHGYDQMNSSIFSGVITGGPYVVGNVAVSAKGHVGSDGYAAPIEGYNQKGKPDPKMMASTVSELMGASDNPWKNFAQPLVKLNSNGTLYLPFGKGKLIE